MKIEYRKVDSGDPDSAFRVFIDGVYAGAVTSSDAQNTADKINIDQGEAEASHRQDSADHIFDHGRDDWMTKKEDH